MSTLDRTQADLFVGIQNPKYSPLSYWRAVFLENEPAMRFAGSTRPAFEAWQARFREVYERCLGLMPEPEKDFDLQVEERLETDAYTRFKISFAADRFSRIPAYLFLPSGSGPRPAVLCPHGHGRGKVDPAGIADTDFARNHLASYNYNYAEQFARRGYVTLAPDLRAFGERTDSNKSVYGFVEIEEGDHWCDNNLAMGMYMGYNMLTLHVFDMTRCVDYLESHEAVDSERIGIVGLSQGGTAAFCTAAYDIRIRVAGVSGYLNSWRVFPLMKSQTCGSQIVPGLLRYGDHPEIGGLICPRPAFYEMGTRDPIFPIEAARDSYRRIEAIYAAAGAASNLSREEFDGVHEFRGRDIFDFFERHL